ncbi:MAG: iron ABC transporter permease [Pseudomonadota bacterium]
MTSNLARYTRAARPAKATRSSADAGGALMLFAPATLALAAVLSLGIGPTSISLGSLPAVFASVTGIIPDAASRAEVLVLFDLRLPRTLVAMFVGAALAVAGAMMQGMFRNPLADPGLIGVSAGAALFAIATIALGDSVLAFWSAFLGIYALPLAAFLGGLATTLLLVIVAARSGTLMMATLLLAGIAFGALAGALSGLIAYASDDRELRDLTLWSMGSLSGSSWEKVYAILPFAIALAVFTPQMIRALNGLLLGEAEAYHLGINVEAAKRQIVMLTAAAVGAAVAVAGVIGFVGIVVPHVVRLIAGPDHRFVLPASAMLGAIIVVVADIIARTIVAPAELPIGIVMAAIGAPIFLHLVLRRGV